LRDVYFFHYSTLLVVARAGLRARKGEGGASLSLPPSLPPILPQIEERNKRILKEEMREGAMRRLLVAAGAGLRAHQGEGGAHDQREQKALDVHPVFLGY
jgi:hypothetical protein